MGEGDQPTNPLTWGDDEPTNPLIYNIIFLTDHPKSEEEGERMGRREEDSIGVGGWLENVKIRPT